MSYRILPSDRSAGVAGSSPLLQGRNFPGLGTDRRTGEESDRTTGERGAQAGERVDENPSIPSLLILLHNIGESSTGFRRGVPQGEGERLQGIGLPSEYRGIAE